MKASHLSTFSSIRRLIGLASDPVITMEKIRKSYGDFAVLKMGRKNIFFCFHPDLAQDVFQKNQSAFRKSRAVFDQIIPLTGRRGLVQLEGKDGLAHRRLTIKAFSSASLLDYLSRFAENFANFRTDIQTKMTDDSALDLAPHISKLVLRNALSMVIGTFDEDIVENLLEDLLSINTLCGAEIRRKTSLSFLIRRNRSHHIKKVETSLSQKIHQLMEASKQSQQKSLTSHLFEENIDPEQMQHHVRTFLFAGFETTTTSILMSLYLLAKNPEVKQKVQAEVRSCHLEEMPSLRSQKLLLNCYKEALRLYPPSWTLAREAVQDTSIGDEAVKPGDQVFFGLSEIHRHETFWKNPHDFFPDRFNEEDQYEFAYLPFGAGSRICIGMQTAYVEACYVIGAFLKEFDISIAKDFSPIMRAQITSHPTNGLPVYIKKVSSHA